MHDIQFTVNGHTEKATVQATMTLLDLLRDRLALTGTKEGCGIGECGACTVLLDGNPIASCLMLAVEADGHAIEIERLAEATAEGIRKIAIAINEKGGTDAVNLRIAEQYIAEFGNLAKTNNSMIIPSDLADIAGMVKAASSVLKKKDDA